MPSNRWNEFIELLFQQSESSNLEALLTIFLTPYERDAIKARVSIFKALLESELPQREISARLGVSIATITRGSNNLKSLNEADTAFLKKQFGIDE